MENYEWWKEVENANKEHNNKARRERIATSALQGLCAQYGNWDHKQLAEIAVRKADALIAELDKEGDA